MAVLPYVLTTIMEMKNMNKLSYGLISLLSIKPMTGYDLTMRINRFWRSTHSAIYPLLSELQQKGYIEVTLEKQNGKLDKKIYNLTIQGKEILHGWFISQTSDEVIRDEMTLKLYCIKCMDTDAAEKLLSEIEIRYKNQVEEYKTYIEKMRIDHLKNLGDVPLSLFGAYMLTQRALNKAVLDLEWCKWVRNMYEIGDLSFLNEDFNY